MRLALLGLTLLVLCAGGGFFAYRYYGGFGGEGGQGLAFIDTYGAYQEIAVEVERLTHVPGTEGNTDRSELLSLLNSILTEDMEPAERDALARKAFVNVDALKKEIDAAQAAQATLYGALDDLDSAAQRLKAKRHRTEAIEIATQARAAAEISARITSTLAETNDQTYAIITRILDEGGELTFEHITQINDATQNAEDRFTELSKLYDELVADRKALDSHFKTLAPTLL